MSRLIKKLTSVAVSVSFVAVGIVEASACGGGYRPSSGYIRIAPAYPTVVVSAPVVRQVPMNGLPLMNNANGPIQGQQIINNSAQPVMNNGGDVPANVNAGGVPAGNGGQVQQANFAPQPGNDPNAINAGGPANGNPNLRGPAVNQPGPSARQVSLPNNGQLNAGGPPMNNGQFNTAAINRAPANRQPVNNVPVNNTPVNNVPANNPQTTAAPMNNAQLMALQALEAGDTNPTNAVANPGLAGNFTATLGNNATITLSLGDNGTFRWSAVNNGKSSDFEGTFSFNNGLLTLQRSSDSQKLEGTLTTNGQGFNFKLNGAKDNGLNFVRG